MPQPNFQYEKSILGHMGSSKEAAQKHPIMNYEQLRARFFQVFLSKFYLILFFIFLNLKCAQGTQKYFLYVQ